jgi:predicted small metal-binding protein
MFSPTRRIGSGCSTLSDVQKEEAMAKTYTCRDVGVDCDWKTTGATEDEVMETISEHAAKVHPTINLTPELVEKVRGAIKDE